MKSFVLATLATGGLASAALALAGGAAAAPTASTTVDDTVNTLRASGYSVIVNRTGGAPSSQCTVHAIRPGQTYSTTDTRGGDDLTTTVAARTVYVDVTC